MQILLLPFFMCVVSVLVEACFGFAKKSKKRTSRYENILQNHSHHHPACVFINVLCLKQFIITASSSNV